MSGSGMFAIEPAAVARCVFMVLTPVVVNHGTRAAQPLWIAHADFNFHSGKIFRRISRRTPQWFEQSFGYQNGNIMILKTEQPGNLLRIEARRRGGEVQEFSLFRSHGDEGSTFELAVAAGVGGGGCLPNHGCGCSSTFAWIQQELRPTV